MIDFSEITTHMDLYHYVLEKERQTPTRKNDPSYPLRDDEKTGLSLYHAPHDWFNYDRLCADVQRDMPLGYFMGLHYLTHLDIRHYLPAIKHVSWNQRFDCFLFPGQTAWISKGQGGHIRYFTEGNYLKSFDIVDLLDVYYGTRKQETLTRLRADAPTDDRKDEWVMKQETKYLDNLTWIHYIESEKHKIPALYHCIKPHLKLLETLNVLGNVHLKDKMFSFEGDNVFFASNVYIAQFLDCDIAQTNRLINFFTALGLLRKVPFKHVPTAFISRSKQLAKRQGYTNHITYYTIPSIVDVVETAEKRATDFQDAGIRLYNVTKKDLERVLTPRIFQAIFDSESDATTYNTYEQRYVAWVFDQLAEQGYILRSACIAPTFKGVNKKRREAILTELMAQLKQEGYTYKRPNKDEISRYHLTSSFEYILTKK